MGIIKYITLLLLSVAAPSCAATDAENPAYYALGAASVSVTRVSGGDAPLPSPLLRPAQDKIAGTALIAAGSAAWKVIKDGRPSAEASSSYYSAIPPGFFSAWSSVSTWKGPEEYVYDYKVTNMMGIDVIHIKYKISFYYGGTEGSTSPVHGSYISNLTVKPVESSVKWGWHFSLETQMSDPMNMGTVLKPVAQMQADLKWNVSTLLSPVGDFGFWSYVIDGNGNFRDLSAEQRELTRSIPPPQAGSFKSVTWN